MAARTDFRYFVELDTMAFGVTGSILLEKLSLSVQKPRDAD